MDHCPPLTRSKQQRVSGGEAQLGSDLAEQPPDGLVRSGKNSLRRIFSLASVG